VQGGQDRDAEARADERADGGDLVGLECDRRWGYGEVPEGTGGQASSPSAGPIGRPTSARIRWLIARVVPKVSH
jgi:hypothetical protein